MPKVWSPDIWSLVHRCVTNGVSNTKHRISRHFSYQFNETVTFILIRWAWIFFRLKIWLITILLLIYCCLFQFQFMIIYYYGVSCIAWHGGSFDFVHHGCLSFGIHKISIWQSCVRSDNDKFDTNRSHPHQKLVYIFERQSRYFWATTEILARWLHSELNGIYFAPFLLSVSCRSCQPMFLYFSTCRVFLVPRWQAVHIWNTCMLYKQSKFYVEHTTNIVVTSNIHADHTDILLSTEEIACDAHSYMFILCLFSLKYVIPILRINGIRVCHLKDK